MADKPYPPRMRLKKGRLYHVYKGKWTPLGPADELDEALRNFRACERKIAENKAMELQAEPWKAKPRMAPYDWLRKNAHTFYFTDSEIIREASQLPWDLERRRQSGVYFVVNDGQIVYVGKSRQVEARLDQHRIRRSLPGVERAFFIFVPEILCDEVEAYYIWRLQPPENVDVPSRYDSDMKSCFERAAEPA